MANLPIVRRADAVEARGDVHEALRLVEEDVARRPDSEMFWRPDRVKHLVQLAVFESVLPAWAYSRWILQQAVRWMDESQRARFTKAFDLTVKIAGGAERYAGVDAFDSECQLIDHDWVYRQLVLYEYGGLQHFLDKVASPALIGRADRIRGWARASMGAYRLVGHSARSVTWWDLASEREVQTVNIGSASLVEVGEHIIGRLVTTEGGPMFESAPIFVPPDVAGQVAADTHDWMSAIEDARHCDAEAEDSICTQIGEFRLLSDVPETLQHVLVSQALESKATCRGTSDVVERLVAFIRMALAGELDAEWFDPWPVVGAIMVEPSVLMALVRSSALRDGVDFVRLAQKLVSPAAEICVALATERGAAA